MSSFFVDKRSECIIDDFDCEHVMEQKNGERYLDDLLAAKGTNIENIASRIAKGTGIIKRIMIMIEGSPLGNRYFEFAIISRAKEMDLSETVDTSSLRGVLKAPKSNPKEMFFFLN